MNCSQSEYVVVLILDTHFGMKLQSVAKQFDVWVIPSPENRFAVEALWREKASAHQVTIWSSPIDLNSEDAWRNMLNDIQMHHEVDAHGRPLTGLEIIGPQLTQVAKKVLADFQYTHIQPTSDGYSTRKDKTA